MSYIFLITVIAAVLIVLGIAMFTNFQLDNEHYDRLKWVVIRWPYLVTFIGVIAKTFSIPHGVETVTVVAAIGAMLAGLMGISTKAYEHGEYISETMDTAEDQTMMAEDMLEEDEQAMVKGEQDGTLI